MLENKGCGIPVIPGAGWNDREEKRKIMDTKVRNLPQIPVFLGNY
jgi:hypothetical protein